MKPKEGRPGDYLLDTLSERLTIEFGKGFDRTNISKMRAFYLAYPIVDALRPQLTWTHYRLLLRVEKPEARTYLLHGINYICLLKKNLSMISSGNGRLLI